MSEHARTAEAPAETPELPPTPDFDAYPIEHAIAGVEVEESRLRVAWDDGRVSRYPFPWLRENCPSPETTNAETRERVLELVDLPADLHPVAATLDAAGALCIEWSHGGHVSRYHPGWLRAHDFAGRPQGTRPAVPVTTWDAETLEAPPTFDGPAALREDAELEAFLRALAGYGLARLEGVPTEPGTVADVAHRIGTIRGSNFGHTFDVMSKPQPDSNAYTALALNPHTDLPTREVQPGLQLLHCLVNEVPAGESVMVDGFRVAEAVRAEDPDIFHALATLCWEYTNRGPDIDHRWSAPILELDAEGRPCEVRYANAVRGHPDTALDDVDRAYAALRRWQGLLRQDRFRLAYPFRPGDLVAFDNRRILHARAAFDPSRGRRHLQGCYMNRDELHSRLRVLARRRRARSIGR